MPSSKFIEEKKKLYKSLKPCYCPALDETVYFTAEGLNHLLYKRRRPRGHNEKHYRCALIPHVCEVVSNAKIAVKRIESEKIITWSLEYKIKVYGRTKILKVILKKTGAGRLVFLSAMLKSKNNTKKT